MARSWEGLKDNQQNKHSLSTCQHNTAAIKKWKLCQLVDSEQGVIELWYNILNLSTKTPQLCCNNFKLMEYLIFFWLTKRSRRGTVQGKWNYGYINELIFWAQPKLQLYLAWLRLPLLSLFVCWKAETQYLHSN